MYVATTSSSVAEIKTSIIEMVSKTNVAGNVSKYIYIRNAVYHYENITFRETCDEGTVVQLIHDAKLHGIPKVKCVDNPR